MKRPAAKSRFADFLPKNKVLSIDGSGKVPYAFHMNKLIPRVLSLVFLAVGSANAFYCGGDVVHGNSSDLYSDSGGRVSLVERCSHGCTVEPRGISDHCAEAGGSSHAGGLCGDYPSQWCRERPNIAIHFAGQRFLNRECTTYVAYKRWKDGKPFANKNAGAWPGSSHKPTVHSVAIWNAGTVSRYGHVAFVTAVSADSITVSEFNFNSGRGPFFYNRRTIKRGRGWPSRFWN